MATKKAMKARKPARAKTLHKGKKLEAQKTLKKAGGGVGYLKYNLTQTYVT
jgi:hypothetical protein